MLCCSLGISVSSTKWSDAPLFASSVDMSALGTKRRPPLVAASPENANPLSKSPSKLWDDFSSLSVRGELALGTAEAMEALSFCKGCGASGS